MGSKSCLPDEVEECDDVKEWVKQLAINEVLMAHAQCETGMMDQVMQAVFDALEKQERKILARIHHEVDEKLRSFSRSCCPWQEAADPERSPERSPTFGYSSYTDQESPRIACRTSSTRLQRTPSFDETTPTFACSSTSNPSPLLTLARTTQGSAKDKDSGASAELQQMKLGPLQRRALNAGVTQEEVDAALEQPTQQHQRQALISLIESKQVSASAHMDGTELNADLPQAVSPDEATPSARSPDVPEPSADERDENCESDSTDGLHELQQAAEELQELSNAIKHRKPDHGFAQDTEVASEIGTVEAQQTGDEHHVLGDDQGEIVEANVPCDRTD